MLEKISAEDFGPIYEKTEISFQKGKTSDEYGNFNIIENTDLLKTVFFYGSNNSGKSQILKLIGFLKDIIELGKGIFSGARYFANVYVGKIKNSTLEAYSRHTKISYFFLINNSKYIYELEICFGEKKIYKEILKKDSEIIFERNESKVNISHAEIDSDIFYLTHQVSKEGGNEAIKEVYNYIKSIVFINPETDCGEVRKLNSLQIEKVEKNLQVINKILKRFGFDFKLEIKEKENDNLSHEKIVYSIKEKIRSRFGLLESFGTECFLKLLIEIINADSDTIVIDEVERGLNFEILSEFIKYLNKIFPQKQFIYAIHMNDLLEEDYRKDQFYITEIKDSKLVLKRAFDSEKYRRTHNFRKIYTSGAVGGIADIQKAGDKTDE